MFTLPRRLRPLADVRVGKYAVKIAGMEDGRVSRKLLGLKNAALVLFGIFTALNCGSGIAYVAGMWFGSH